MIPNSVFLSKIEIASGMALIAAACVFFPQLEEDPHGLIFFSIFELGAYGIVTLICGLTLLKLKSLGLASQCIFIAASVFMYVEFFTSYSGWWL